MLHTLSSVPGRINMNFNVSIEDLQKIEKATRRQKPAILTGSSLKKDESQLLMSAV